MKKLMHGIKKKTTKYANKILSVAQENGLSESQKSSLMARKIRKRSTHEWTKIRRKLNKWIQEGRVKILRVSRKLNIKQFLIRNSEKTRPEFVASNS